MVQLPATAAIEYVAACWVSAAGGLLSGGMTGKTSGLWNYYHKNTTLNLVYLSGLA